MPSAKGHSKEKIEEVWQLVAGFNGYAFCGALSTAYGVEAYQAAWLKRYHPAEFMAAVLNNAKDFYSSQVYPVLEVEATVEPYDNGRGFTLRVHRVGKPRCTTQG